MASSSSIEEARKELAAFLNGTKVNELEAPKAVIEVTVDMTPTEAAKLLWKEKVIGAPVWDGKKYLGFFDMRDLLSTVLASHKEEEAKRRGHIHDNIADFFFTKWFLKDLVGGTNSNNNNFSVSYLAARNPFVSLTNDATLMDVCKMCAQRHCHRVPIIDPETRRCVRIVSQSALVKFLVEKLLGVGTNGASKKGSESLQNYFARTLKEANFPYQKQVLSAPDTATAQEVFELMDEHRLSGIAVVDRHDGALIGNTSASDIKLAVAVDEDSTLPIADLNLNIMSYLSGVRQEEPSKVAKYPSSHVRESSSTLAHAFKLLAKTGYHRVFVVDEELKPVGVVSVTDVVDYLAKQ